MRNFFRDLYFYFYKNKTQIHKEQNYYLIGFNRITQNNSRKIYCGIHKLLMLTYKLIVTNYQIKNLIKKR